MDHRWLFESATRVVNLAVDQACGDFVFFSTRRFLNLAPSINQNNVERKHAIHENRLASVKASLSLSTPRRMDFMDKRLSKNFHMRRQHKQVVHENLKLLRALEEIHSRNGTTTVAGTDSLTGGGGGTSTMTVGQKERKGLLSKSADASGSLPSREKLSSLLARKRNVKAAIVARENQKMMEVSKMYAPA